ncbi:Importin subunit alpha,Atypical Arm repeat,Armadillo-like helical,Armadillo-type fold,Importin- [Cinara cedri]|uniref:Importin subunit alpha n=1 Tax=Cinara cedri TaxID=506608 RepID=A0A5E4MY51_9HEMI|nr:Importin subunit alpha,Atypical Arm repeat,Armadillo-like helical,Armadillo-type fold,Importin- [Cinara cedri]
MPAKKTILNSRSFDVFQDRNKYYEDLRRKRNDVTVQLRKTLRDEQVTKHRNIVLDNHDEEFEFNFDSEITLDNIKEGLMSDLLSKKLNCLRYARKMLSSRKCAPIDDFIKAGILPLVIDFLSSKYDDKTDFQYECAWILTNIASGSSENTISIVNAGVVPLLINLLKSPDLRVMEQAVWALGNISGDGPKLRDIVLSNRIVPILKSLLEKPIEVTAQQNIVWTISNLCRSKNPPPDFTQLLPCVPLLVDMLKHTDFQVVSNACWALSYLTDGSNEKIQVILEAGALNSILKYLDVDDTTILIPALRVVGNIVSGNDIQTKHALDHGVLKYLHRLLSHKRIPVVKDAAWLLSNVMAGNVEQIQCAIDHDLLPVLVNVLQRGDIKVQKEAAWAINNLFSGGTLMQKSYLLGLGVLEPYCGLLLSPDIRMVEIILEGLSQLLEKANIDGTLSKICILIEEISGLDHLEALQNHTSQKIYEIAYNIIEKYFQPEDTINFDLGIMPQDTGPGNLFI